MELGESLERRAKEDINNNDEAEEQHNGSEVEETSIKSLQAVKKINVGDHVKTSVISSTSRNEQQEKGILKIGNTFFVSRDYILEPKENMLAGKFVTDNWEGRNSYLWSTSLPSQVPPIKNISTYAPGTFGIARDVKTELGAFEVYFTESMFEIILNCTNEEIKLSDYYLVQKSDCNYPVTVTELKAFVGLLLLAAVKKDNRISKSFLWGPCGSDIYNAVMSKERFEYLIRCLRFDDYTTRHFRKQRDSFADIREFWEKFVTKCSEVYRPSSNCTIDDIFIEFNGDCSFQLPVPKKTEKYGIKMILLCDTNNRYIISGSPYLKKKIKGDVPLAEYMVEKLTKPIHGTYINITYGNDSYNSIPLTKRMAKCYKLTSIGLLDSNNNEIPPDVIKTDNRPVGSAIFLYNIKDNLQLCSYYPNIKEEINILLSNMHFESAINEAEGKPKVLEYYELTNNGVSEINNMCRNLSCSRRATKWFVAVFYAILDFACINSLAIFNMNRSRHGIPHVCRIDFLYRLALDLMLPFMKERLTDPNTDAYITIKINSVIEERIKLNTVEDPSKHEQRPTNEAFKVIKMQDKNPLESIDLPTKKSSRKRRSRNRVASIKKTPPEYKMDDKVPIEQVEIDYEPIQAVTPNEDKGLNTPNMTVRLFQAMYPPTQSRPIERFEPIWNLGWNMPIFFELNMHSLFTSLMIVYLDQISAQMKMLWQLEYYKHLRMLEIIQRVVNIDTGRNNIIIPALQGPVNNLPNLPALPMLSNNQKISVNTAKVTDLPKQPAKVVQQATPVSNAKQSLELNKPSTSQIALLPAQPTATFDFQPNPPKAIQAANQPEPPKPIAPKLPQPSRRPDDAGACGVCNIVAHKKTFAECARCFVLLCSVHRIILCDGCFTSNRPMKLYSYELRSKIAECSICGPQKEMKFSAQCHECSKFVCLDHRQTICCFCTNMI